MSVENFLEVIDPDLFNEKISCNTLQLAEVKSLLELSHDDNILTTNNVSNLSNRILQLSIASDLAKASLEALPKLEPNKPDNEAEKRSALTTKIEMFEQNIKSSKEKLRQKWPLKNLKYVLGLSNSSDFRRIWKAHFEFGQG